MVWRLVANEDLASSILAIRTGGEVGSTPTQGSYLGNAVRSLSVYRRDAPVCSHSLVDRMLGFHPGERSSILRGSTSFVGVSPSGLAALSDSVNVGSIPSTPAVLFGCPMVGSWPLNPAMTVRFCPSELCTVTRRGRGSPVSGVRRVRVPYSAPCPVLLAARQPDSQSGNIGSIPVRDATFWKAKWQWCHTGFEYRRSARVGVRLLRLPPLHLEDEPIKDRACLLNSADAKASGEHALRLPPIRGVAYRSGATFGT